METIMNKSEFVKALMNKTKISEKDALIVNKVLESNFFISKKNKDKIISEFVLKLDITINEATGVYEDAVTIINEEIKRKIKHPFRGHKKDI